MVWDQFPERIPKCKLSRECIVKQIINMSCGEMPVTVDSMRTAPVGCRGSGKGRRWRWFGAGKRNAIYRSSVTSQWVSAGWVCICAAPPQTQTAAGWPEPGRSPRHTGWAWRLLTPGLWDEGNKKEGGENKSEKWLNGWGAETRMPTTNS